MNKKLIAVYGSLRKGMGNDHYVKDADYIGEFKTEPVYSLYSLGGYPGLKENGETSVVMEVYAVTKEQGKDVDRLEGYSPNRPATFYDKKPIDTPFGKASVYVYVDPISEDRLVKSGDWKEYRTQKVY